MERRWFAWRAVREKMPAVGALPLVLVVGLQASVPAHADGGVRCGEAPCQAFSTAQAAFAQVLHAQPALLALGEYHARTDRPRVVSTIKRFMTELLPSLQGRGTSFIAETWMTRGSCGVVEKKAVAQVEKTTKRPKETEDELTSLLYRTSDLGMTNHILLVECDDYRSMLDEKGELDPLKTLEMVRRKVEEKAQDAKEAGEGGTPDRVLVLYGGALHNDLYPLADYRPYSFGPALSELAQGAYVELDLIVPELAEDDGDLKATSWWRPAVELARKRRQVVLVEPAPRSFALVWPPTARRGH